MPHVVTQSCCSDAACVVACPVNCIHPGPTDAGFPTSPMVFIDPSSCVDCGACVTACPVDAIKPHTKLEPDELVFLDLNANYFKENPHLRRTPLAPVHPRRDLSAPIHVAIVGAGPAGMYAADEVLRYPGARVDMYERLDTPYGLARFGVAPDHRRTRSISRQFDTIAASRRFTLKLGTEVSVDITHDELAARYSAVIYTVGASGSRELGIPGDDLPGSMSATAFVGWYNGHPDHRDLDVKLDREHVVVVGNGNVALDVARILTTDPDRLAKTDISPAALQQLRESRVRHVTILGRRGTAEAAFTLPELIGLSTHDADIEIDNDGQPITGEPQTVAVLESLVARKKSATGRRVTLTFRAAPRALIGTDRVEAVEVDRTRLVSADGMVRAVPSGITAQLEAGMVLRSVGFLGQPVAGLPFDESTGTVPNFKGRVAPGVYVAGWIKRGPTGFLGTNRSCARETVGSLIEDLAAGVLQRPLQLAAK